MPCQQRRQDEGSERRLWGHTPPSVIRCFTPSAASVSSNRVHHSGHAAVTDLTVPTVTGTPGAGRTRRAVTDKPSRVICLFDLVTLLARVTVLVLLTLVGVFLLWQSRHAWAYSGFSFFTTVVWSTNTIHIVIGVAGLLFGTIVVALIAECIAVPMGILAALFIAEYAPLGMRKVLQGLIDLLAAIPSLLFGPWGFLTLQYQIEPLSRWLTTYFGWIPIFQTSKGSSLLSSMFIAGIVVSLMCIPIVASICRAVFAQTPPGEKEAALALGATKWGMIRTVVLPYGRGGIIGGSMLGLGRALGETIAVTLILPQVPLVSSHILQEGGGTIAGFIAQRAGSDPFTVSGLMAAGLVLFALTLTTNLIASTIVSRSRSGSGSRPVTAVVEHPRTDDASDEAGGPPLPPDGPSRQRPAPLRRPRRPRSLTKMDVLIVAAAAVSSVSLCWLIFSILTDGVGWLLFWIVAYLLFLAIYFVATYDRVGWLAAVDRTVTVAVATVMILVLIPLVWVVVYVLARGLPALRLGFFIHTQKGITPTQPASARAAGCTCRSSGRSNRLASQWCWRCRLE